VVELSKCLMVVCIVLELYMLFEGVVLFCSVLCVVWFICADFFRCGLWFVICVVLYFVVRCVFLL
jgi:hypothetical protein